MSLSSLAKRDKLYSDVYLKAWVNSNLMNCKTFRCECLKATWQCMLELDMLPFIAGGQEIQDECNHYLKQKGSRLHTSDVFISGSGRLPCKAILHAVGPVYEGGNKGEENCLCEAVLRCLNLVNDKGYVSIAIPAISSGIFRYPPAEATRVIVTAIKSFLENHPLCIVREVYLCAIDSEIRQCFDEAVHTCFPGLASALPVQEAGNLSLSLFASLCLSHVRRYEEQMKFM